MDEGRLKYGSRGRLRMEFGEEFRMIKEGLRMGVEGVEEGRKWE